MSWISCSKHRAFSVSFFLFLTLFLSLHTFFLSTFFFILFFLLTYFHFFFLYLHAYFFCFVVIYLFIYSFLFFKFCMCVWWIFLKSNVYRTFSLMSNIRIYKQQYNLSRSKISKIENNLWNICTTIICYLLLLKVIYVNPVYFHFTTEGSFSIQKRLTSCQLLENRLFMMPTTSSQCKRFLNYKISWLLSGLMSDTFTTSNCI